jgi:urate oxidase
MAVLAQNSYGKSAVRLVKIERSGQRHDIRDFTVDIALEGDFERAHTDGDNSLVLPTDTMKNTVYAKARETDIGEPEDFASLLADHFLRAGQATMSARVSVTAHPWSRLHVGDRPHDTAFERAGAETRFADIVATRAGDRTTIAGIDGLLVLKSAHSAFEGYPRDKYTTLKETSDRILATSMSTRWRYRVGAASYGALFAAVRRALIETFAEHDSKSVQHTLYAMAARVIEECDDVEDISITMPNKHHLLVDLSPFGLDNPNEIFVATEEPYGLIQARVKR